MKLPDTHAAVPILDDLAGVSAGENDLIRQIEAELRPASALGGVLARRVGHLSARLERSGRQERAAMDERVRHAGDRFDEDRRLEVDRLMASLANDPASNVRALRRTPEGVDRMIGAWRSIRADLVNTIEECWTFTHHQFAENLMGRRTDEMPRSRIQALSRAIWEDHKALDPDEQQGLDPAAIRTLAKAELYEVVASQIEGLESHRKTLDLGRIALDRLGAADRALTDLSPAATLARKQEAADERGLFRALKEFRQVEAEFRAKVDPVPDAPEAPTPAASPEPAPPRAEGLGSFGQPRPPAPAPTHALPYSTIVRHGEGPMAIGGGPR